MCRSCSTEPKRTRRTTEPTLRQRLETVAEGGRRLGSWEGGIGDEELVKNLKNLKPKRRWTNE